MSSKLKLHTEQVYVARNLEVENFEDLLEAIHCLLLDLAVSMRVRLNTLLLT